MATWSPRKRFVRFVLAQYPSAVAQQLFTVHCQFQQRAKVAVSL